MDYSLTEEQIAEFKEVFALIDTDHDGVITTKELKELIVQFGPVDVDPTDGEVDWLVRGVDINANGSVDFPEFLTLMARNLKDDEIDCDDEIKGMKTYLDWHCWLFLIGTLNSHPDLFNWLDGDGDGNVDQKEIMQVHAF
jgi:Ca2+-binding EF-hand superfamily protein